MARNRYPEETVEKILEVAQRLFLEKGYDNTTIQDIVDNLGGLTKGAIYHYFKSKEDIMNALGDKVFYQENLFLELAKRDDLSGLEKLQEIIKYSFLDASRIELNRQRVPMLKNPRMLSQMIEANQSLIAPTLEKFINEGIDDGSINTEYAKEISDVIQLLGSIWLAYSIYPGTSEELKRRLQFLKEMTDHFGVHIFTEEIINMCNDFLEKTTRSR